METRSDRLHDALVSIGNGSPSVSQDGHLVANDEILSAARNSILRNSYTGQTAIILTCGPSLSEVWNEELRAAACHYPIICIKQALHSANAEADFHLINEVRLEQYDYENPKTLRLSVSEFKEAAQPHIHYPIRSYRYEDAMFVTKDYETWRLDKRFDRPWGVGIMFELGLHLPIHLGCDRVIIVGFDMNQDGKYHFYDDTPEQDSSAYGVDPEEFAFSKEAAKTYVAWAASKGVDVLQCSPLSSLPIPQIKRNNLIELLKAGQTC